MEKYFILNELGCMIQPVAEQEALNIGIIKATDNTDFNVNIHKICYMYFNTKEIDFGFFRIEDFNYKGCFKKFTITVQGEERDIAIQIADVFFGVETKIDLFQHMEEWLGKEHELKTNTAQIFAMLCDLMVKMGVEINSESTISVKIV